jgi:ATP-dependent Clp protease ATP-binding subunit ClpB
MYLLADALRTKESFEEARRHVMEALQQQFKPEFLNRVDDIIIFNPLAMEQLSKIVELRLEDLRRMLAERKVSLEINDSAKRQLITQGYDINYGARPLKRAIQRLIQDPLAMKILDGEVLNGDHIVVDGGTDGRLEFQVERHAPANVTK